MLTLHVVGLMYILQAWGIQSQQVGLQCALLMAKPLSSCHRLLMLQTVP